MTKEKLESFIEHLDKISAEVWDLRKARVDDLPQYAFSLSREIDQIVNELQFYCQSGGES